MRWLLDTLFPPRADEVVLRDVSADDLLALLAPQVVAATRPASIALLPFSDSRVRSAIHEAKYHGSEYAFSLLGSALAEYLCDADDLGRAARVALVPVPLGRERHKERGFNQVEEVARRATKQWGGAVDATLLARVRETASQVSLVREKREENMRGAFGATRPADPAYTYILVDDVLTTGATLQAAIDALKEAGATHIIALALALAH